MGRVTRWRHEIEIERTDIHAKSDEFHRYGGYPYVARLLTVSGSRIRDREASVIKNREVREWCRDNLADYKLSHNGFAIYMTERDAIYFKLRWIG